MSLLRRIPNEWRGVLIVTGLAIVLAGVSFQGGRLSHAPTFTRTLTHNRSVSEQYGRPTQSVDGAQINPALKGLTCDVFQAKQVILCHR